MIIFIIIIYLLFPYFPVGPSEFAKFCCPTHIDAPSPDSVQESGEREEGWG